MEKLHKKTTKASYQLQEKSLPATSIKLLEDYGAKTEENIKQINDFVTTSKLAKLKHIN